MLLVLVVFAAIRYDVGWDYGGYYRDMMGVSQGYEMSRDYGPVWEFIYGIPRWIPLYWLPISLIAIISNLLIYYALKIIFDKHDDIIKTALIFYAFFPEFYLTSFSIIRQSFAIAICFFAICLWLKHKNKKTFFIFIALLLFAGIYIHSSSLVTVALLPMYVIHRYITQNISLLLTGGVICFCILLYFTLDILTSTIFSEYDFYLDKTDSSGRKMQYVYILILVSVAFGYKYIKQNKDLAFVTVVSLWSMITSMVLLQIFQMSIVNRILWYYTIMLLCPVAYIINRWKKKNNGINILYVCALLILFSIYLYLNRNINIINVSPYIPYKTIFSI